VETISREIGSALDPWYVTGFIDGVGTLTYSRSGRQIALYLALKVPARDQAILESIRAWLGGIGKLYALRRRGPDGGPASCYYRVCRHDELVRVVDHLDAYPLRGSKAAAYAIWREMVLLKLRFRDAPRDRLQALAQQLSAATSRLGREPG
jgi:LAGLIDADG DNA endonuclease family protein